MNQQSHVQINQQDDRKVSFLLGLGILFVPYVFSWFTLRKGYSVTAKGIAFGWLGVVVLFALASPKKSDGQASSNAPRSPVGVAEAAPAAAVVQKTAEPLEVFFHSRNKATPCRPLADSFGMSSKRTELQMDESFKGMKDRLFQYEVRVKAVEVTFGSLTLQVACPEKRGVLDSSDFILSADDDFKPALAQLAVDSALTVCGKFTGYTRFTGLHGDLVALGPCPNAQLVQ